MALILDGTNGLSDVDGSAATPAIRGSDANTGVFFPAADVVGVSTGGSERVRVDANGRVLIGLASSVGGTNGAALQVKGTTGSSDFSIALMDGDTTVAGRLHLEATGSNSISLQADPDNLAASTFLGFGVDGTERARIDSVGNLSVGTTSNPVYGGTPARLNILKATANYVINSTTAATTGEGHIAFRNPNGIVGAINTDGSSTAYATSSDYRLKHDVQPMQNALATVAQLKPVTYKWNADDSQSQGFIAHELQEVVPECVTGEKDAVDAEGNPQYQGIDTSFLVATLTAAIQELKGINDAQAQIITALTARVEALEGAQA
jgi:hypothetical protein